MENVKGLLSHKFDETRRQMIEMLREMGYVSDKNDHNESPLAKATSGTKEIFNMSSGEIKFMTQYKENYTLVLITDIKSHFPKTKKYTYSQIMKMRKEYPSTRFYAS